ncbi:MAG: hypothetical protein ACLQBK_12025 [Candidatus Sulfotelmatobacter sp.]
MGNHPLKDLMVTSPSGVAFSVDVKGLYKKNHWPVTERPKHKNLFYIFAFVPDNAPNQFFILTQEQTNTGIRTEVAHTEARQKAKGLPHDEVGYFYVIEWNFVFGYKDCWATLPK